MAKAWPLAKLDAKEAFCLLDVRGQFERVICDVSGFYIPMAEPSLRRDEILSSGE